MLVKYCTRCIVSNLKFCSVSFLKTETASIESTMLILMTFYACSVLLFNRSCEGLDESTALRKSGPFASVQAYPAAFTMTAFPEIRSSIASWVTYISETREELVGKQCGHITRRFGFVKEKRRHGKVNDAIKDDTHKLWVYYPLQFNV